MTEHDFDVALTFAGEDRLFVEPVARLVKEAGFTVFYDEDQKYDSWGQDLTEYFPDIYERRARFAVMFISKHYAAKPWTRLERRSVLTRALDNKREYLLPVRLDSTTLPGVRDTIAYLDGLTETPAGIARAIVSKLGSPSSTKIDRFNGHVPRTATELQILLGERPPAWQYLQLSYHLHERLEALDSKYVDHKLGFSLPSAYLPDAELAETLRARLAELTHLSGLFESLLLGPAQEEAMGKAEEAGNPDLIEGLAERIIALYSELLAWESSLHGLTTESPEGAAVVKILALHASQPIEAMHQFVLDYRSQMDEISPQLASGENIAVDLPITWELPKAISLAFDSAMDRFARHMLTKKRSH